MRRRSRSRAFRTGRFRQRPLALSIARRTGCEPSLCSCGCERSICVYDKQIVWTDSSRRQLTRCSPPTRTPTNHRMLPSSHELWQESSAVAWLDAETGAGGYIRIGHEPNWQGGEWALGFGVVTREGVRYRCNESGQLTDADRLAHGLAARDGRFALDFDDGALQIRAEDDRLPARAPSGGLLPAHRFLRAAASASAMSPAATSRARAPFAARSSSETSRTRSTGSSIATAAGGSGTGTRS